MYMYNGTNTTNPTEPPVGGGLTAYDIILIVGAVFLAWRPYSEQLTAIDNRQNQKKHTTATPG